MQQSQKTAAESKPQRRRSLRLVLKGRIVELQFLQRFPQVLVFGSVCRIEPAINHRIHLFIARQCFFTGLLVVGDGIPHAGISHILYTGCEISHHPRLQFIAGDELSCAEIPHFHHFRHSAGGHHADRCSFLHASLHNPAEHDHPFVRVVEGIENQCL